MSPYITIVAFDLETTGLDPEKDEIIEIAGVKFSFEKVDGKIKAKTLKEFGSLIKPTRFIPEDSTAVHHITNQMVENAPTAKEVIPKFLRFCGLSSALVAHNASFDAAFLAKAIRKNGIMPQNPIIDSLKVTRKLMPESVSHKLSDLAKRLNTQISIEVDKSQLHRGLYDCQVLKEVFSVCLRKRFQEADLAMATAVKAIEKVHGQTMRFTQFAA